MALLTATKDNFEEMIAQENAVVEFWAPWCGYCKRLGPVMKALGNELSDVTILQGVITWIGQNNDVNTHDRGTER